MKRISIIANVALSTRQFLRTPIFELLKNNPNNYITVYTLAKRLAKEFKSSNVKVRSSKYLIGIKKSDIILLSEWSRPTSKSVLEMSKKKGIPVLAIQEGADSSLGGYPIDVYPTKIAVWGDVSKQFYIKRGIAPERITVTGQPRFDWYYKFEKTKLFSEYKKVLLYSTQPLWRSPQTYPEAKELITRQHNIIYEICQSFGLQLVCKLHPSDDPNLYERKGVIILEDTGISPKNYIREYCNTGYDPKVEDLKKLGQILYSADIATTIFSATGLEAFILNKPTIFFDTESIHQRREYNKYLAGKVRFTLATSKEEFALLVKKYLNDPEADSEKRKKVVYDFTYKQDGKASERVVNEIEKLLS